LSELTVDRRGFFGDGQRYARWLIIFDDDDARAAQATSTVSSTTCIVSTCTTTALSCVVAAWCAYRTAADYTACIANITIVSVGTWS
jgi:hypothetical protein